ncbi:MAG: Ig-like domain-containing protein [Deltaproteobacteria bacterium]|nr:Ig-like domain-containing protein [Deltaproteobacteria bacterium]
MLLSRTTKAVLLAAFLGGCPPAVEKIEVDPATVSLNEAGKSVTLKATPKDKQGKELLDAIARSKWESSNPGVAKVEAAKVTAVKSGDATVTVTIDGKKGTAQVQVTIPAKAEITPATADLDIGGSVDLAASVKDDADREVADAKIAWSTSDGKVAGVVDGKVTAMGPGTAKIGITSGALTAEATINVKMPVISKVTASLENATVKVGESTAVKVEILDDKNAPVVVKPALKSSNEKVATIAENGMVMAVGPGKADITATVGGQSAKASLTVKK